MKAAHKEIHHEKCTEIIGITYDFIITCSIIMLSDFSRGTGTWTRTITGT